MGSTIYYTGDLPIAGSKETATFDVFASTSWGEHGVYLEIEGSNLLPVRITQEEAIKLIDGLKAAMRYIGHNI